MCEIKLTLENEDKDLLMTIIPVEGMPKANLKKLQIALKFSEHSDFLPIDGAMELLLEEVAKADETETNTENETDVPNEAVGISSIIANAVDANVNVTLGPENMSATLELTAGYGGKHVTNADVVKELKENAISKGVIKENLINIVKEGIKLQSGKSISTEIARGKGCVNGDNGYIKYLVDDPADRIMRPKKLDNNNVDMRELGDLMFVKAGTKLAKIIPPTYGVKGFNVIGNVIEATPGEAYSLEEAEGSSFSDENKNIIIATLDGMPKHLDNSVAVNKLLEIENIDVGSGNIRFDGSIFVKGNVCEGMKLYASEDIVIAGLVESATISSGGNITIAQGVIGRQISEDDELKNSTILQANGDVTAQFVQYADICSKNEIKVAQYISHSQINVEGHLWVGNFINEKADGKVFGCFINAGGNVNVGTLGSKCGAITNLSFNYWADYVEELRVTAEENTHKIVSRLPRMYKLLEYANTQDKISTSQIDRITNSLRQHLRLLGKLNKEWLENEGNVNEHLDKLELCASQSILSGVNIEVSSKACVFKRDYEASKVQWIEKKINVEPIVS
jgi:uncharacterized protein (DUF342 family)